MKKALIIGSLNVDTTVLVDKFPEVGETIISKSVLSSFGGKGLNQAIAISKMNIQTEIIGKVGEEKNGLEIISYLKKII